MNIVVNDIIEELFKLFLKTKRINVQSVLPSYNEPFSSKSVGVFECSQLSSKLLVFSIREI